MITLPEKYKTLLANKIYQSIFTSSVSILDDDFKLSYKDDKFDISIIYYILINLNKVEEDPDDYEFDIYDDFVIIESGKDISNDIDSDDLYDGVLSKLDNLIVNGNLSNSSKEHREKQCRKFKEED